MTKEDVDSSEKENVAALVSSEHEAPTQTENNGHNPNSTESNGAQSDAIDSGSNSPQPREIQNIEIAAATADEDDVDAADVELIERMRGDAVGDTMYSKKFILSTLIRVSRLEEFSEDLENDLCKLWDMSSSADVVPFLLENDAIEMIMIGISEMDDVRLYEILLGMLSNMCYHVASVQQLTSNPEWMEWLLKLCNCMDTAMLTQLMRVYHLIMTSVVTGKEKLAIDSYMCFAACENSAKNIGNILLQSTSDQLLVVTLKAVNAILASCAVVEEENSQSDLNLRPFADIFLVPELCDGVNHAFTRLMRDDHAKKLDEEQADGVEQAEEAFEDDPDEEEENSGVPLINCDVETIQTYLNICTILVQLPEAQAAMDQYAPSIMFCISRILIFLQQTGQLLPIDDRQEEYLEDIVHICGCLKFYYHKDAFANLIKVWLLLKLYIETNVDHDDPEFGPLLDISQYEGNALKLLLLLAHILIAVDPDVLIKDLPDIDGNDVHQLVEALLHERAKDVILQRSYERLCAILINAKDAGQAN